jgi:hypothetical protein
MFLLPSAVVPVFAPTVPHFVLDPVIHGQGFT